MNERKYWFEPTSPSLGSYNTQASKARDFADQVKLKFPSEERADKILNQKLENASNHRKQKKGDEATFDLEYNKTR